MTTEVSLQQCRLVLIPAIRLNGPLQRLHTWKSKGYRSSTDASIPLGQYRDGHPMTVPRRFDESATDQCTPKLRSSLQPFFWGTWECELAPPEAYRSVPPWNALPDSCGAHPCDFAEAGC